MTALTLSEKQYLAHYGILRKSGRYPWGSGADAENQRHKKFLDHVADMKSQGMSDVDIAKGLGISTTQLRDLRSIAKNEKKQEDITTAQRLKDKGMSNSAIGKQMGINESSVRSLLSPGAQAKTEVLNSTVDMLKRQVAEKKYLDIGTGTELYTDVSETKMKIAVTALRNEGYKVHYVKVPQLGTGKDTTAKVLVAPGTEYSETYRNRDKIRQISERSYDGGHTYLGIQPPLPINSKRVGIKYKEEGGAEADGVIYVRPGVKDVSIGANRYAQVRIAVDGTHYLKGMAMYKEDLPDGVDLLFNTNKSNTGNKLDAMKKLTDEPDNPFNAIVNQMLDPRTGKVTSAMNMVGSKEGAGAEGDWDTWSRSLASQFLSKQSPKLAETQLAKNYESKKKAYDEIQALTNPTVKKKLLRAFSDQVDSSAVALDAAPFHRQSTHVILPMNSLKENEIYAPNFRPGERVALVRFPHGGTFEIPELVVNNSNPTAKKMLGDAKDAVGIHHKVAERLSGADFDGDTVLVIPNNSGLVKTKPALQGLKDFDPKAEYPAYDGMPTMGGGTWDAANRREVYPEGKSPSGRTKGREMGNVSNLITDMTIKGANDEEIARAVRHSMVVIDAEKHALNWKLSAQKNGIAQLKTKYQGGANRGASTLISLAGSEARVPDRIARRVANGGPIDKATGKLMYQPTGKTYPDGRPVKIKSKKLAETDNAHTLSSGTRIEEVYATHSNKMKALANEARLSMINTPSLQRSPSAATTYSTQVKSLDAKLSIAKRNRPAERQAQIVANTIYRSLLDANPNMDASKKKKFKGQALTEARTRVGAKKQKIQITDEEWHAIQAGAISNHKLNEILDNADLDQVKKLATPKATRVMSPSKQARAEALIRSGHTQAEVADAIGVSVSTLKSTLNQSSSEGG